MSKKLLALAIVALFVFMNSAYAQEGVGKFMPCKTGDERPCGPAADKPAPCKTGIRTCVDGQWTECAGAVWPKEEACTDGVDNDCNGKADDCYFEFPVPSWLMIAAGALMLMFVWVHEKLVIGKREVENQV
jgi:hypothetical protein